MSTQMPGVSPDITFLIGLNTNVENEESMQKEQERIQKDGYVALNQWPSPFDNLFREKLVNQVKVVRLKKD